VKAPYSCLARPETVEASCRRAVPQKGDPSRRGVLRLSAGRAARLRPLLAACLLAGLTVLIPLAAGGCTRESVRIALEAQHRADDVQQAVFERQHEAVCVLLYRDLAQRLEAEGTPLTGPQRAALNAAWNDRDLAELWARQYERASALRVAGVDAQLAAQQSVVDLLWKGLEARGQRARRALAEVAGAAVAEQAGRAAVTDDVERAAAGPAGAPPSEGAERQTP